MQLIAFILIYPILLIVSILPFRLLYMFSDVLYFILYRLIGYRISTVKDNLKLVFPNKSEDEINVITNTFYRHLCDMIVEAIKSMSISKRALERRFTFSNLELIHELEAKKRSIALMCGHYASWEWIFALQMHVQYEGYAIYKKLRNPYFDKLVKRIRARHNSHLITTKETYKTVKEVEARNELAIYGFAADQSPRTGKGNYWLPFLGINVPVFTGAENLSKKHDFTVIFMRVSRLKRGYYSAEFEVLTEDPRSIKDYEITDRFYKLLEQQIIEAPAYYLWTHKRWKHRVKD